jgi:regulator of sigma E protease
MFGCRVEKFYLFMDWPYALFKKKIGETEFGIGCAPLGGYVKIAGFVDESMDTDGVETDPEPWELRGKPAWQRLIVMLGGIIVNIVLAWFIYSMIAFSVGEKHIPIDSFKDGFSFSEDMKRLGFQDGDRFIAIDGKELVEYDFEKILTSILFGNVENVVVARRDNDGNFGTERESTIILNQDAISDVVNNLCGLNAEPQPPLMPNVPFVISGFLEESVAKEGGVEVGDRIVAINDSMMPFFNLNTTNYLLSNAEKNITLHVERNGEEKTIDCTLKENGLLGVVPPVAVNYEQITHYSFFGSFKYGVSKTKKTISNYWQTVKAMFSPSTGTYKCMGGMISIGSMFPEDWNWLDFWSMTAFLSIILAVMNLLPIPALDGGHALIAIGEMLTGKKLPIKVLMPLQIIGMIILLMLMVYANGMDVLRLFN